MSIWHGQGLRSESEDHVLDYNEYKLGKQGLCANNMQLQASVYEGVK